MLAGWEQLQQSDLFTWFGLHEVDRVAAGGGGVLVRMKPGGFQESIDLAFTVRDDRVERAELALDRSWAGLDQPRAESIDLTKSFVAALTAAGGAGHDLARAIEALLDQVPGMILRGPAPVPAVLSSAVRSAVDVFLGRSERASVADGQAVVTLESTTARLLVTIAADRAVPDYAITLVGTTWRFAGPGDSVVHFLPGQVVTFESPDMKAEGRWSVDGPHLTFDCNGFTIYEVEIDGDHMGGRWRRAHGDDSSGTALSRVHER